MIRVTLSACVLAAALLGCNSPGQRLNAPPHGEAQSTSDLQGTFVYMHDNALLANMTVGDRHFMPHRPALNTTGVERLSRLASLMEAYGGTIRFDTEETDEKLNHARLKAIRDFLAEAGIDTTAETVTMDLAGGDGMDAREAILIRAHEGTYSPNKKDGAPPAPTGQSQPK